MTGVAGFIGSHLAEALLAQGCAVIGIDRRLPQADSNLADCLRHPNFTPVGADLAEVDLPPLFEGIHTVFHLAGIPGMRPSWGPDFAEYTRSNVLASQRVADACLECRVPRLVVASSSSVYGQREPGPYAESCLPAPASPYGVSKLAGEQVCLAYAAHPRSVTSVVALRYFTVYGPRQRDDMLIGRALRAALSGEPLRVYGEGSQRRDFTYISDVVAATLAAATAPAEAEVINVGGGRAVSIAEVLTTAERLTGRRVPRTHQPAYEGDVPETLADPAKAARLLGWQPEVGLADGMARQLAWLTRSAIPVEV
ncbi:NAD-dependent epimerase/dehydratase family protein [Pseudonocardiaceae bacterium YIM PH 21723]|nr:NAD-dependent epimerase/dehydratase family protein [Pseudonocardiaceae bacterium YIM PH 21723]